MAMEMAMALLSAPKSTLLPPHKPKRIPLILFPKSITATTSLRPVITSQCQTNSSSFPTISTITHLPIFSFNRKKSCLISSALPRDDDTLYDDEWGEEPQSEVKTPENGDAIASETPSGNVGADSDKRNAVSASYVDEWGEKTLDPEDGFKDTKLSDPDPPILNNDEWGKQDGSAGIEQPPVEHSKLAELKQCLVDCFYGTEYGLRASSQTRAEIGELISQLEAENPTPAPTEALSLLQGKWILVYTSFSELLPLIAAGTLPFVKLGEICQAIDTYAFTVENSASYIGPFATFSFSALASFEVRSPKRIQVKFEEGIIRPPEISSTLNIPEMVEIFGQKVDLSSFQGSLHPLQEVATRISQVISGQPPIKLPIRRDGAQSWLLITYLDENLRISRGDGGGLFVLVKEGSSLLNL
eukprot:Gb_21445 [translate_table: standard]